MTRLSFPDNTEALIFDCDGTIADTMPAHYRAWVQALGDHGHLFTEALFYDLAGMRTERIIELLNERFHVALDPNETAQLKEHLFLEQIGQIQPIKPVVEVVRAMQGKLPMAVATGGIRAVCERTLRAIQLDQVFDAIVTSEDVKHGKPAPDMFIKAAALLNVRPERCVVFEDAELGLQAAAAAGMHAIDIRLAVGSPDAAAQ